MVVAADGIGSGQARAPRRSAAAAEQEHWNKPKIADSGLVGGDQGMVSGSVGGVTRIQGASEPDSGSGRLELRIML